MFTRTFSRSHRAALLSLLAALVLSGCGLTEDRGNQALIEAEKTAEKESFDDGKIPCAVAGETMLTRSCQVEQAQTERGLMLTVRHPDGGFRRLMVKPGPGVVAADGSDPAKVTRISDREIEVRLAADIYHLPATVRDPKAKAADQAAAAKPKS